MRDLFADAPSDVETGKVADGHRTHRHAVVVENGIHVLHARAFFGEELRLTSVRTEHAIAYEPEAVADQHTDFADLFAKLHACGDDGVAGLCSTHDLEQLHDIRGTEEMGADHRLWPLGCGRDFVDAERRSIR